MMPAKRAEIVAEALTWENTPYHHKANLKGVGVDCIMIIVEVFKACGLIPADVDPRPYSHDWHLHRNDEIYLGGIEQFADRVDEPLPGDIVLFQFGRCISHGAIVLDWPLVLHAYLEHGAVVRSDISTSPALQERVRGFYSVRG